MRRAALGLALLAAAGAARAWEDKDQQACPPGTMRVATNQIYEPFHCVTKMDPGTPFIEMKPTFKLPHCPKGYIPVETPGQMHRFRCHRAPPRETGEPDAAPSLAPKPPRSGAEKPAPAAPPDLSKVPAEYLRYTVRNGVQFDYPKAWHLTDGWDDEVPTLYIEYDTGRQGKQVTLVLSKIAKGQYGYDERETAIAKEKEFRNAADGGSGSVGGLNARFTSVAKESRTAYVALDEDSYFTLTYSAPEDLFARFEPVYRRLLDSFKAARRRNGR